MLTINAEIKKDGLRSNGTYNVKLRFTLDRKMRRVETSLFADKEECCTGYFSVNRKTGWQKRSRLLQ